MMNELTEKKYWDSTYAERVGVSPVSISGYRHYCAKKIYKKKEALLDQSNKILEIGGGGSAWLLYLAEEYPDKRFSALDYSEVGCKSIKDAVENRGIRNVDVWKEDFFNPSDSIGEFDFVYSHGVVEHFADLSAVLTAHAGLLSVKGKMLTIIPNMAGVLGLLTRWLNRSVYDIHVPHDLNSFKKGHLDAGLSIIDSGYLCSNNFGVLSSCVRDKAGLKWRFYKILTRFSKIVWYFENKFFDLPTTKTFSPYIYVVSERLE